MCRGPSGPLRLVSENGKREEGKGVRMEGWMDEREDREREEEGFLGMLWQG